jgi:TonB family protein
MWFRVALSAACLGLTPMAFSKTIPPVLKSQEIADFSSCTLIKDKMYTPYVAFRIDRLGRPRQVRLTRSSGNACVDQSAVQAAATFVFEPAKDGGKPVSFQYELGIPMMDIGTGTH